MTEESREYDQAGRLLATTDKYTGRIAYQYDLLGNRIALLDPDKGAFADSYVAANRVTAFTDSEGKVTSYSYDELGRVFGTILPNNSGTVNSYDAAGNRLSENDGSKTISYCYNAANQLLQACDVRYVRHRIRSSFGF